MGQPTAGGAAARRHTHRRSGGSWPFMAKTPDQAVTEFGVGVPPRQELQFADGSRIWLLRVEQHRGVPDLFLRDLGAPAEGVRVDLRHLVPELDTDLPVSSTRDVAGTVFFAMRGQFKTRDAFIEAAIAARRPA